MDSKAASKIKAPPIRVRLSQLEAPSSTDDTLANSTSDSMTSAVVWAANRAAPRGSVGFRPASEQQG